MHSAKEKTKPRSESENQQMKMKHETKQNETKKKLTFFCNVLIKEGTGPYPYGALSHGWGWVVGGG